MFDPALVFRMAWLVAMAAISAVLLGLGPFVAASSARLLRQ
jgi:hypothetical protein